MKIVMKKISTEWKIFTGYMILIILMICSQTCVGQSFPEEGLVVVEFNASFSNSKCEYLEELDAENVARVDIATNPKLQTKHKIVVIPTLIIFYDGEEKGRVQANIMMQLTATKEEVQEVIDNILMEAF